MLDTWFKIVIAISVAVTR